MGSGYLNEGRRERIALPDVVGVGHGVAGAGPIAASMPCCAAGAGRRCSPWGSGSTRYAALTFRVACCLRRCTVFM